MAVPTFRNPLVRWIDHRLPIFSFLNHELHEYPKIGRASCRERV